MRILREDTLFTTSVGYIAGGLPGAAIATFFVFLPSFIFILVGATYIELVRNNRCVQAFLARVGTAVVEVILVVSFEPIPGAAVGLSSVIIVALVFVAIGAIITGIG